MTSFKGTPGPWFVGDEGTTAKVVSDNGLVCEIGFGWDEDADSRAISDARLIAAAPCLLDALTNLLAVHESEGGTKYHAGDIARNAIKKALGQ